MLLLSPGQSERPMQPPGAMVTSWPMLLLMAMSESIILQQMESVCIYIIVLPQGPT